MQREAKGILKPKQLDERLLNAPKLPELAAHVWEYFEELQNERQFETVTSYDAKTKQTLTFKKPRPISYVSIQAWLNITGVELEPWELKGLLELDRVFLKVEFEK